MGKEVHATFRDLAVERFRARVNQAELAEQLGIAQTYLSFLENNEDVANPTAAFAERWESAVLEIARKRAEVA